MEEVAVIETKMKKADNSLYSCLECQVLRGAGRYDISESAARFLTKAPKCETKRASYVWRKPDLLITTRRGIIVRRGGALRTQTKKLLAGSVLCSVLSV